MNKLSYTWILCVIAFAFLTSASAEDTEISESTAAQEKRTISIHVLGEVRTPGKYSVPQKSTIKDTVAAAGGFNGVADDRKISVTRKKADGSKMTFRIDLSLPGAQREEFILTNDDVVFVPAGSIF